MKNASGTPVTYLGHPHLRLFRKVLFELFLQPDPERLAAAASSFLRQYPLPPADFPVIEKTYSRTILHKGENGFEAMAARWDKDAVTPVHGHPSFIFYHVLEGGLAIDNYRRTPDTILLETSSFLGKGDFFFFQGEEGRFDNHIHQVHAIEETLSIHISSDDSTKGELFSETGV